MGGNLFYVMIFNATLLIVGSAIFAIFLSMLYQAIRQVRQTFRAISPPTVWFCLIPIFGAFFAIWVVNAVSISLRRQFEELGQDVPTCSYGLFSGRIWTFSLVGSFVAFLVDFVFENSGFVNIAMNVLLLLSLMSWIVYWVQLSDLAKRLRWLKRPEYSPEELDFVDELKQNNNNR